VVVLSNFDGCVVARSEEAKALGIEMGTPVFEQEEFFRRHGVAIFSSNYALYADMSRRVMETLSRFTPRMEVYSIDESFLALDGMEAPERSGHARSIRSTVRQWTGIPVSVGIGPTKTLAKLANSTVKKTPGMEGVFDLGECPSVEEMLERTDVEKVWGIGPERAALLRRNGIETALHLRDAPDRWVQKHLTVVGFRTVLELRGIPCLPLEAAPPPRKTVTCSRSFGRTVERLAELREAVAFHVSRAAEKLRAEGLAASRLEVFIHTSQFSDAPRYAASHTVRLALATHYTPRLVAAAHRVLERIYRPGYAYKRAGITLTHLVPEAQIQLSLFESREGADKERRAMAAVDAINRKMGGETVRLASSGFRRGWSMRQERRSNRCSTHWEEILKVETDGGGIPPL
jgi:DNA polymerase V